jgi:tetratricopeptide (TPR) repeat protein
MAEPVNITPPALKEFVMRYFPAALSLSLLVAVTASAGFGATGDPDPRAARLIEEGKQSLDDGRLQAAVDAFEAALVIDPGYTPIFVDLARAARKEGLQGKAIRYYREALQQDPDNFAALSGEGEAMVEKGAIEKARRNLTKLESLCGQTCAETKSLASSIEAGPKVPVLTAEAVQPQAVITQN